MAVRHSRSAALQLKSRGASPRGQDRVGAKHAAAQAGASVRPRPAPWPAAQEQGTTRDGIEGRALRGGGSNGTFTLSLNQQSYASHAHQRLRPNIRSVKQGLPPLPCASLRILSLRSDVCHDQECRRALTPLRLAGEARKNETRRTTAGRPSPLLSRRVRSGPKVSLRRRPAPANAVAGCPAWRRGGSGEPQRRHPVSY